MEGEVAKKWVEQEITGLPLPDKRFQNNIIAITHQLAENIGQSFSSACGERLRKSAWRLFSKEELFLLSTHQHKTLERCGGEPTILVVEDPTDIVYQQKQKKGMGALGGPAAKGLNMHSALALALTTTGLALGIVHQKIWAPSAGRGKAKRENFAIEEKETIKWNESLRQVNHCWTDKAQQVVLIGDREADFFEHYAQPREANVELLVRVQQKKRKVYHQGLCLPISSLLGQLQPLGSSQVKVWRRPNKPERFATVSYYVASITLPPTYKQTLAAQQLNLVWVKEAGATGIEWVLLTSLPVATLQQATIVADYYSLRWVVERFHYILKSGLGIERLQIDTFARLYNALQVYALVAWHLLWLYRLGQQAAQQLAATYIEADSIQVLETVSKKKISTIADFLILLGMLGGFHPVKKQPLPGEKSLWIGLMQLSQMKIGFFAAKEKYGTG